MPPREGLALLSAVLSAVSCSQAWGQRECTSFSLSLSRSSWYLSVLWAVRSRLNRGVCHSRILLGENDLWNRRLFPGLFENGYHCMQRAAALLKGDYQ